MHVRETRRASRWASLGAALLAASSFAGHAVANPLLDRDRADLTLTILHNDSGESGLLPREIEGAGAFGGIANFAGLVRRERITGEFCPTIPGSARRCGVLLLNSGDNFLAGPQFQASREAGAPFFDALAVRGLRYDAVAIGNHEFDFGPGVFGEFVNAVGRRTPFVSANLDYSGEPALQALEEAGRLRDAVIVSVERRRIGIFGLTTPTLAAISSPGGVVASADLVAIATAQVESLRRRGAEIIIMQSHLQGIAQEIALIAQLSGVDAVIAGGGGELLANPDDALAPGDVAQGPYPMIARDRDGNEVPVVTTSGSYEYLGRLVLNFDRGGRLLEVLDASGALVVRGDDIRPVGAFERAIEAPVADFVARLAANVLANSEVVLDCERADVRGGESNCGNLIADSILAAATAQAPTFGVLAPDVALQNGGGIGGEIDQPVGPFSEADSFRLAPFANFVSIAENVPAETFREILEEGAVQIGVGLDGGFVQASGFSYTIDPARAARQTAPDGTQIAPGDRIRSVVLDDGTIVVADGVSVSGLTLTLAASDFSLAGGDGYPPVPFTRVGLTSQQALSRFVSDLGTITEARYPRGGEGRIAIVPGDAPNEPERIEFINPAGGDWSDAANWSLGRVPDANDHVILGLPVVVTVTRPEVAGFVEIPAVDSSLPEVGVLIDGGRLDVTDSVTLGGSTFVSVVGGAIDIGGSLGTDIDAGTAPARVMVAGGVVRVRGQVFVVDSTRLVLSGDSFEIDEGVRLARDCRLDIEDASVDVARGISSFDNNVIVISRSTATLGGGVDFNEASALFLSASTLDMGGSVFIRDFSILGVNDGSVLSASNVFAGPFDRIAVSGGSTATVRGDLGIFETSLSVLMGATLEVQGDFSAGTEGQTTTVSVDGGTLRVLGAVRINEFDLAVGGTTRITATGGTLDVGGPFSLGAPSELQVGASGLLTLRGGLTLDSTLTLADTDRSATPAVVEFAGTQSVDGTGQLVFAADQPHEGFVRPIGGATVTFGPDITITGGAGTLGGPDGTIVVQGTFDAGDVVLGGTVILP